MEGTNLRLFEVLRDRRRTKESEQTPLVSRPCDEASKTIPASIIPKLTPLTHSSILIFSKIVILHITAASRRRLLRVRTQFAGATINRVLLAQENGLHGLAEESLTLFPNCVCGPLFTSLCRAVQVMLSRLVLGDQRDLVGAGQGRKRGTCRRGRDSCGSDLRNTTVPLRWS